MRGTNSQRRGVSLLELLAAVALIGLIASITVARYHRSVLGNFGAHAEARKLSLALLHAQRASVLTGDNHYVEFNSTSPTSYNMMRRTSGSPTLVYGPTELSADTTIATSTTVMEFNFEGQALGAYWATMAGDDRTWRFDVIPITGTVRVQEL